MAKIVKIKLNHQTAAVSVDAIGFHGKGCDAVMQAFEKSLGAPTKKIEKPEYKQERVVLQNK